MAALLVTGARGRHLARMTLSEMVRRHDPDRYFCALFAPEARRAALMTLYAFNHELARAVTMAREPGLALIRLHWWREVVEGARRRHEVAAPLGALIDAGHLPLALLASMVDAREDGMAEEPGDAAALMRRGPGAMMAAAGAALGAGVTEQEALAQLGAGCGMAGVLRNAALAPQEAGWRIQADRWTAEALLGAHRAWPRRIIAAALPAALARRDLARPKPVAHRRAGDLLAVLWAAATCRI